jgi:hypothetical protein
VTGNFSWLRAQVEGFDAGNIVAVTAVYYEQSNQNFMCRRHHRSACPLGMEIWLDDQQIFNSNHVTGRMIFEHELSDTDGEHVLKFV